MASIYKRKHERRDPNAKWLITYRDERGERKTIAGCTEKRATEEIARKRRGSAWFTKAGDGT